jgi:hypothetical protein
MINNDLQNTTQKTKDLATRTPLKTGGKPTCSGREICSCSSSGNRRVRWNAKRICAALYQHCWFESSRGKNRNTKQLSAKNLTITLLS